MKDRTLRFSGLEWYDPVQSANILIVGAGGIGSWCALFLSRILENVSVTVMDYDIVDEYNMGGQFFNKSCVGSSKVAALQKQITGHYGGNISPRYNKFTEDINITGYNYIIAAVDNMDARRFIFNKVNYHQKIGEFISLIDGRLLAESYQIFSINNSEDLERYSLTLFNDDEAPTTACSAKATTHCGAGIAADITGILLNMVTNNHYKDNRREVPFMISKHFDLMIYETNVPKIFQTEEI